MKRLASRKFILAMATLAVTAWLCAAGHIHEGVYSAGNVGQKFITKGEAP